MDVRFVVVAVALSSSAVPGPTPGALHLIGRGPNAVGICGNVVVHANAAIAAALQDDQTLERSIDHLRTTDFEDGSVGEHGGIAALRSLNSDLSDTSARGAAEVQRLRGYASREDEDRQRAELSVFADALGSAIDRQQKMAADLGHFLGFMAAREMRGDQDLPSVVNRPAAELGPRGDAPPAVSDRTRSPNTEARNTASDLDSRFADVRRDESHAADLSEAAVGGC